MEDLRKLFFINSIKRKGGYFAEEINKHTNNKKPQLEQSSQVDKVYGHKAYNCTNGPRSYRGKKGSRLE